MFFFELDRNLMYVYTALLKLQVRENFFFLFVLLGESIF
jgi:hypothetical protein